MNLFSFVHHNKCTFKMFVYNCRHRDQSNAFDIKVYLWFCQGVQCPVRSVSFFYTTVLYFWSMKIEFGNVHISMCAKKHPSKHFHIWGGHIFWTCTSNFIHQWSSSISLSNLIFFKFFSSPTSLLFLVPISELVFILKIQHLHADTSVYMYGKLQTWHSC